MVDWCPDEPSEATHTVRPPSGDGPQLPDMRKLDEAMKDMRNMMKVNAMYNDQPALREMIQGEQKAAAMEELAKVAGLTEAERAERAAKQKAHEEKLASQRAKDSFRASEEEKVRRERAKKYRPGTMGIGIVPVRVGSVEEAYEYKLEFKDVTVHVPLPEGVTAKMLVVDIGVRAFSVGLKGKSPYLKGQLCGRVVTEDTVWMIEEAKDGHIRHIRIELTKADTKDEWPGALTLPEDWECAWSL